MSRVLSLGFVISMSLLWTSCASKPERSSVEVGNWSQAETVVHRSRADVDPHVAEPYSRGGELEEWDLEEASTLGHGDSVDQSVGRDASETSDDEPENPRPEKVPEPSPELAQGSAKGDIEALNAVSLNGETPGREALDRDTIRERVRQYIRRLRGDKEDALAAYRELCKVDARLIPALLTQVESRKRTRLERLQIVVLQRNFSRYDQKTGEFIYLIQGLSPFYVDDVGAGKIRRGPYRGRGSHVHIRREGGFPVGVVLRAALLNRIKGERFPSFSSERNLRAWWKDYYLLAKRAAS